MISIKGQRFLKISQMMKCYLNENAYNVSSFKTVINCSRTKFIEIIVNVCLFNANFLSDPFDFSSSKTGWAGITRRTLRLTSVYEREPPKLFEATILLCERRFLMLRVWPASLSPSWVLPHFHLPAVHQGAWTPFSYNLPTPPPQISWPPSHAGISESQLGTTVANLAVVWEQFSRR